MECSEVVFSGHAVQRMFERSLKTDDILEVIRGGEEITGYPNDMPYPSVLLLGFVGQTPVHVVIARASDDACHVITTYVPSLDLWNDDFRTRRLQ